MERETFQSRLGFLLLSAGCAIGIGNVWKFPYMVGNNGGGIFVLFYLLFLAIMGVPILSMELAIGRGSKKSTVRAYGELEKKGQKWHIHGYVALIGNYLLMMFYTTVAGWMLHYFYMTATGKLSGLSADAVADQFTRMLADPGVMMFWMVLVVVIGVVICAGGLQNGLERVTKVMMIALLAIMVVLAINSFFMTGAKEGLKFYLVPDFGRMQEVGVVSTLVGAMNQAFFTLSLGIGAMAIFGSYIGKDHSLMGESVRVVVLDTFVAITAGLIIFPACFTYGVDQTSGPSLIFITLPNIFANMAMGRLWGSLFFLFMAFAALSTVLAVFENIICCGMELTGWNRQKSSLVNFFLNARRHGGVANIGVDLHQEVRTDDHRLGLGMVDIGRNDGTALGDLLADKLGGDKRLDTTLLAVHVFADGDILHLLRDDAFAGAVHDRLSLSALCPRLAEFRKTFAQVDFHLWVAIRTAGVVDRHGRILDILLLAIDHLDSRRECHLAHTDAQLWEEHALAIDLLGGRIGEMRIELFGFHIYCCSDCSNIRRMAFVSSTGCSASRMPPLIATPLTPVCSTGNRSARVIPPMATTGSRIFSRLMASTMARYPSSPRTGARRCLVVVKR